MFTPTTKPAFASTCMMSLLVMTASWALLLGACGPAPEGEELEAAGPGAFNDAKPRKSGATAPYVPELMEPGTVSQQSFAGDLGSRLGAPIATYNTCSASNQWRTTCGSGSSRDVSYVWRVPETGAYSFSTINSSFDTVLEIRNYRATSEVMGCNDDTGSVYQSRVTLTGLVKGVLLLITIEGYEGDCGNVQLNISKR